MVNGGEYISARRILGLCPIEQSYIYQGFRFWGGFICPGDVGLQGAGLEVFTFFPRFLATRVTNCGALRPCIRAARAMRAISAWVASTRTLNTSHLLKSPFRSRLDSGLGAYFGGGDWCGI